jgi:hypothetical protein
MLLCVWILVGIVEEIKDKEVYLVSIWNRCECKAINHDISFLVVASASKEHLDDNKHRFI